MENFDGKAINQAEDDYKKIDRLQVQHKDEESKQSENIKKELEEGTKELLRQNSETHNRQMKFQQDQNRSLSKKNAKHEKTIEGLYNEIEILTNKLKDKIDNKDLVRQLSLTKNNNKDLRKALRIIGQLTK